MDPIAKGRPRSCSFVGRRSVVSEGVSTATPPRLVNSVGDVRYHTSYRFPVHVWARRFTLRNDLQSCAFRIDTLSSLPTLSYNRSAAGERAKRPIFLATTGEYRVLRTLVRSFVRDIGVGFDVQYFDKLFGVFRLLHVAEGYKVRTRERETHCRSTRGKSLVGQLFGRGATFYFSIPRFTERNGG